MTTFNSYLQGLRLAQVRVIFTLPPQLGRYDQPLAYIKWFTPLNTMDELTGMYIVSRSTRHHRRNAAIVPVEQIARSCHLMAKYSGSITEKGWTSDTVLELATQFYVNTYSSIELFLLIK